MRRAAESSLIVALLACPAPAGAQQARSARAAQAVVLWHKGEPDRAAREFEAVFREHPKDRLSALDAAMAWRDAEDHKRAAGLLDAAVRLDPKDPDAQAALGWEALRSGDRKTARRAFAEASAREKAHPQALLGLARLELEGGHPRLARQAAEKLVAARPQDTLGLVELAKARQAMGDLRGAAAAWEKAFESDPTFMEARLRLGILFRRLRRFNDAWRQFAKVLGADSKNPLARREAADLQGRLTKTPEEMAPTRPLKSFAELKTAAPARAPLLRVAIGTTATGLPAPRPEVAFLGDGPFELYDPGSGRRLAEGPAAAAWRARRAAKGGFEVVDASGTRRAAFKKSLGVRPKDPGRHSLIVQRLDIGAGTAWAMQGDRQLKGAVELRGAGRHGLFLVALVPLEDYLYGVVNGEMPQKFHPEALKAQAVIARNHALVVKDLWHPHRKKGYDLCDGQHCQVYGGVSGETDKARRAVDETRGMVLMYKGRLAQTPYSSNCGGHTQDSGETGGWSAAPYLTGVKDVDGGKPEQKSPWELELWLKRSPAVYCNIPEYMHPAHFRWARPLDPGELSERLRRRKRGFGRLRRVRVLRRSVSGNVNKVAFEGTKGARVVVERESAIRNVLSLASLRDTMFILEAERNKDGTLKEVVAHGGGWGHNVGLCQYGALGRALAGKDFKAILEHYYRGTEIKTLAY